MACKYDSLMGKNVLVTGGAAGIGAAIVRMLCEQKANVAFLDINEHAAELVSGDIEDSGLKKPIYGIVDVCDIVGTKEKIISLEKKMRPFDILINNAGHDETHKFHEVTPEYWDSSVNVNLRHQYFIAQHVSKSMVQKKSGVIINMGSIAWRLGVTDVSAYLTLKSAIEGLTKSLARELGISNIRVNSISPGWILTERQKLKAERFPEKIDEYLAKQCLKKLLEPQDVAKLALWLCSDESRLVTGQTFVVDGGII